MKRFLIFVVLFPLFCLLSLVAFSLVAFGVATVHPSEILLLCAAAYGLMVIPAVLIGFVDRALKQSWAILVCALVGFVSASGIMYALIRGPTRFGLYETFFYGGIGAVSAALCWLIARMLQRKLPPIVPPQGARRIVK
jgi:hypothetical protein